MITTSREAQRILSTFVPRRPEASQLRSKRTRNEARVRPTRCGLNKELVAVLAVPQLKLRTGTRNAKAVHSMEISTRTDTSAQSHEESRKEMITGAGDIFRQHDLIRWWPGLPISRLGYGSAVDRERRAVAASKQISVTILWELAMECSTTLIARRD
jgi:hypothetical protein